MRQNRINTLMTTELRNLGRQKAYPEVRDVDIFMFCGAPLTDV